MDENNRNFFLAIALSIAVLIFWQVFYAGPKMQQEQERQRKAQESAKVEQGAAPAPSGSQKVSPLSQPSSQPSLPKIAVRQVFQSREEVIAANKRVAIVTPSVKGSINLQGGRLDDLTLKKYRQTIDKDSANITLLSPAGTPEGYYTDHGWQIPEGVSLKLPNETTNWTQKSSGTLSPTSPVILEYDNQEGLIFRRTISVDDNYMFTIKREIENKSGKAVTLHPYSQLTRHFRPKTEAFFVIHEGLIGTVGEERVQEISYSSAIDDEDVVLKGKGGWVGITDKYWATALIPDQKKSLIVGFSGAQQGQRETFQSVYRLGPLTVKNGESASLEDRVFAGAKQVHLVNDYEKEFKIDRFNSLIDWGWFYFLTEPMFYALDYFYKLVGNFGLSILIVTFIIKLLLYPLANKAYVSMSRMKKLQPEVEKLRERHSDDKMRQQQAMMELYKKEKINPMSGCLPILVQIPVFFALYKVLFVSIDMRHAPFYGWVRDLSVPDPTSIFNLFGLIPWDPPTFLIVGIWPIIMGITMWVQMKLNPAQPDPIQQQIFTWMPVLFTFLLASFPAGLVIYWAWNNFLSIIQQWVIMRRQGVEIDLFENMGIAKLLAKSQNSNSDKSEKET